MIAFSAVGSLQERIKPRDFVIPSQIIDRTKGIRPFTFFEGGVVGHVGFADPFDATLGKVVEKVGSNGVLEGTDVKLHSDKVLICMGKSYCGFHDLLLFSKGPKVNSNHSGNRGTAVQHQSRKQPLQILGG